MAQLEIEPQQQLGRRVVVAERGKRAHGSLCEVDRARFAERTLQLRGGPRQNGEQPFDDRPRVVGVMRGRQQTHRVQRVSELRHRAE